MKAKKSPSEARKGSCVHCGKKNICLQGRGLCQPCHGKIDIRHQYLRSSNNRAQLNSPRVDPSEEELNALIAEQMRCLPPWWNDAYPGRDDDDRRERRRKAKRSGDVRKKPARA
jgi:hypothetical protein